MDRPDNQNTDPRSLGTDEAESQTTRHHRTDTDLPTTSKFAIPTHTTYPDRLLRHNISDEELEMLGAFQRDTLLEALWGCLGIAAGSFFPALNAIVLIRHSLTITITELAQFTMFATSLIAAIIFGVQWLRRGKRHEGLIQKIKDRTARISTDGDW